MPGNRCQKMSFCCSCHGAVPPCRVLRARTREAVTYAGIRRVQRGFDLWHASTEMQSEHKMTQRKKEGAAYCLNSLYSVTAYHGSPT